MPICEVDPWRMQYFERVACPADVLISTEDADSLDLVPAPSLGLRQGRGRAVSQGLEAAPHGVEPTAFPVFSKPITNLKGMGVGSRVLRDAADYVTHYAPGHMWMTLLEGRHVSSDVAVLDGKPMWWRHATGHPGPEGTFDHWVLHAEHDAEIEAALRRMDRAASRRLHRHDQSRDHRRAHHRGASALRRPVARSLRRGLGRGAGAAL